MVVVPNDADPLHSKFECRSLGVVNGGGVNLTAVDRASHTHAGFGKQVGDFEVDFDVSALGFRLLAQLRMLKGI
jgi:hypothetical protein